MKRRQIAASFIVFCSYAHEDELFREQLEAHLSLLGRQGIIAEWHDREIMPGSDWSQEIDQRAVSRLRFKGDWTPDFVKRICRDLERRHLPLIVDIGGRPEQWQTVIFRYCTHSLLSLHPDNEETANFWRRHIAAYGLLPLAQLYSVLDGISTITSVTPIITGTLVGLHRNTLAQGPLFDLLVERIVSLFTSYFFSVHLQPTPSTSHSFVFLYFPCKSLQF